MHHLVKKTRQWLLSEQNCVKDYFPNHNQEPHFYASCSGAISSRICACCFCYPCLDLSLDEEEDGLLSPPRLKFKSPNDFPNRLKNWRASFLLQPGLLLWPTCDRAALLVNVRDHDHGDQDDEMLGQRGFKMPKKKILIHCVCIISCNRSKDPASLPSHTN